MKTALTLRISRKKHPRKSGFSGEALCIETAAAWFEIRSRMTIIPTGPELDKRTAILEGTNQ